MKSIYFPIKLKLTIWYVLLLSIVIAVFTSSIYFSLDKMIMSNEDTLLKTQINQIIGSLDIENGSVKKGDEPFYINTNLYGALYTYPGLKLIENNLPTEVLKRYKSNVDFVGKYMTIKTGDDRWRVYSSPIFVNKKMVGVIVLSQPLNLLDVAMRNLYVLFLMLVPVTLVVAIIGGLMLANRALKPVDHITKVARDISTGDLSKRLNIPYTNDEIGRLAQTFDIMIDKIDNSFKKQRQFTNDASHELRTPIAIIQSQAEGALEYSHSEDEYNSAFSTIMEEAKHMGKLVSNLLLLARSDSNREKLNMEVLNFSELIDGIVTTLKPIAESNNIDINVIKNEEAHVKGDQTKLTQLLYNIIDNAIKYTMPGGSIKISVENNGKFIKTSVKDTGVGIPQEHLPHIFERFYRVDKARSRKSGGTGLGLSICQWIVTVHGGKIDVESEVGKGSTFTIWLPNFN